MNKQKSENQKKVNRHRRVRAKISGTASRPRLSVYRSRNRIYAQLIDDQVGKTLIGLAGPGPESNRSKVEAAEILGKTLAEQALNQGIKEAIFDKGGFRYHGRVKAVAEAARQAGLKI